MRTILLTLILGVAAAAQTDQRLPEQAQARIEEIKQRLALTPEQTGQVRPILADEMRRLRELRDKSQGEQNRRSRMKMAREARSIRDEADKKLKKILSKQQIDELAKIREERKDDLRERKKGGADL